jgi:NADH:ubiquinone oxidoreductase subunit F (NADH-binding)
MTVAPSRDEVEPRLLDRWLRTGRPANLDDHVRDFRRTAADGPDEIIRAVTAAGLRGRGGAWFPTGRKLQAVAERAARAGSAYVIVNASEGEPASGKDRLLLQAAPHVVLDGAELAAHAVGARQVTVCVHREGHALEGLREAVAERRAAGWGHHGARLTVLTTPRWYVAAEATALARYVGGGLAKPRSVSAYKKGVRNQPTLVSNAETFAHLALIVRHGAAWFRQIGTAETPGSWLVTLSGAVVRPGVYEVPVGASTADILRMAGGPTEPWQAILIGGYGGQWLPSAEFLDMPLTPEDLRAAGRAPTAGIVVGLPTNACGLAETARVVAWMAGQNARQCGPCLHGTPTIARELAGVTWRQDRQALQRLRFTVAMVYRRGACWHPNGIVGITESALQVFAEDVRTHLSSGGCAWMSRTPTLAVPAPLPPEEPWR